MQRQKLTIPKQNKLASVWRRVEPKEEYPLGLLLCTEYGEPPVQYATEGLSQNLFVSKYQLQLPSEEEMQQYLLESTTAEDWEEYKKEQENGKEK